MSQTYKLRLGDGTLLATDEEGLRTWTADEDALVQAAGSNGWRKLKDVIASLSRATPDDGPPAIRLKPLAPPTHASQLPSLRLAAVDDDEPSDDDVYDGDLYDEPGVLDVAWRWTKRLVVVSGLAVGGFFAAGTWETWLPEAGRFGQSLIVAIEQYAGVARPAAPTASEEDARRRHEARQNAAAVLPHLDEETIDRVLATSIVGTLDPIEVFHRSYDAAHRGAAKLPPSEAQELRSLQQQMFARFNAAERDRVRDYEHARGVRVTLPFEDRDMVNLFARGVKSLPEESQGRLRLLYRRAIATTLSPQVAGATR